MELRNMSHCNQIKMQCLTCGRSVGNALRHASIAPDVLATIQEFDYEFRDLMEERRLELFRQRIDIRESEREAVLDSRKREYNAYLLTPKWKSLRAKVIDRENGLCQGCRERRIQHVHHLTYENFGDELLFQLAGLCVECHSKAHGK